jgi:hypothetical protein
MSASPYGTHSTHLDTEGIPNIEAITHHWRALALIGGNTHVGRRKDDVVKDAKD